MQSLSFLHGSRAPGSHSDFLVLINKRGKWWGRGGHRGGEGRGGGDKMASSKSRARDGKAAELRRARENPGPAGYAGACPPLGRGSVAASTSLLCPWTLAPALSIHGERRFIAKVCLQRPQPAPWAAAGGVRGRPKPPRPRSLLLPPPPLPLALLLLRSAPRRRPPRSAAADCSRELAGRRELRGGVRGAFSLPRHTPPFSWPSAKG